MTLVQPGLKKSQIIPYSTYVSDEFFFKNLPFNWIALV